VIIDVDQQGSMRELDDGFGKYLLAAQNQNATARNNLVTVDRSFRKGQELAPSIAEICRAACGLAARFRMAARLRMSCRMPRPN